MVAPFRSLEEQPCQTKPGPGPDVNSRKVAKLGSTFRSLTSVKVKVVALLLMSHKETKPVIESPPVIKASSKQLPLSNSVQDSTENDCPSSESIGSTT